MDAPKQVSIGCAVYDIDVTDENINHCDSSHVWGTILYQPEVIKLRSDLKPHQLRDTLLHEIVHGILWHTGYEQDESLVTGLTTALVAVMRDNPELVAFLMDGTTLQLRKKSKTLDNM